MIQVQKEYKINKEVAKKILTDSAWKHYQTDILFYYNLKRIFKECGIIKNITSLKNEIREELGYSDSQFRARVANLCKLNLAFKDGKNLRLASFAKMNNWLGVSNSSVYRLKLTKKNDVKTILQTILTRNVIKKYNLNNSIKSIVQARYSNNATGYVNIRKVIDSNKNIVGQAKKICKNYDDVIISRRELSNNLGYKSKTSSTNLLKRQNGLNLVDKDKANMDLIIQKLPYQVFCKSGLMEKRPDGHVYWKNGNVYFRRANTYNINYSVLNELVF